MAKTSAVNTSQAVFGCLKQDPLKIYYHIQNNEPNVSIVYLHIYVISYQQTCSTYDYSKVSCSKNTSDGITIIDLLVSFALSQ